MNIKFPHLTDKSKDRYDSTNESSSVKSTQLSFQQPTSTVPSYYHRLQPSIKQYTLARTHKLYSEDPAEGEHFPREFNESLKKFANNAPQHWFEIVAVYFHYNDLRDNLPRPDFKDLFSSLIFRRSTISIQASSANQIQIKIRASRSMISFIIPLLSDAHALYIQHKKTHKIVGVYTSDSGVRSQVKHFLMGVPQTYAKIKNMKYIPTPELESIMDLADGIQSWLGGKITTTIRPVRQKNGSMDLRFYRNNYAQGEPSPLIYNDVKALLYQMARGAFTWIPDTHYESENIPHGPYLATIDIDTSTAEYAEMLERVHDYHEFLISRVGITPILVYSGNISFHFRFPLSDFSLDERVGIFLPKLTTWTTYFRRHKDEMKLIFLRNAIEILTVAYNEWTALDPVAITSIPKYSLRSKFKFFFDNRTGLHVGARIPGSFHHKSQRIARIFQYSNLPQSEAELRA